MVTKAKNPIDKMVLKVIKAKSNIKVTVTDLTTKIFTKLRRQNRYLSSI